MIQELPGEKWQELRREVVFKKYSRIIERVDYKLPDGSESDYYIVGGGDGTCCLALTEDNKVIVAKEYRPGPDKVLYELPGGYSEGQDPYEAAQRELLEETGYAGELVRDWKGSWLLDAYTKSSHTVVIIKNCRKVAEQDLEGTEFIDVILLDIEEFLAYARTGQMTDAAGALLALDHLGLL